MSKERALYFECATGISGDMTVAALLGLGADLANLKKKLASLPLTGYQCELAEVTVSGLRAMKFDVHLDHDEPIANYPPGNVQDRNRPATTGDTSVSSYNLQMGHSNRQPDARGLPEITEIIKSSKLTQKEVNLTLRIFNIIAEAEAAVHGLPLDQVHFHEVGATDSIVDICAVAVCLCDLNIANFFFPALPVGTGFSSCHHGLMPVPVPAVTKIAEHCGLTLRQTEFQTELVTPTGAGIVAALNQKKDLPEQYQILKISVGAGSKKLPVPNLLRVFELEYEK